MMAPLARIDEEIREGLAVARIVGDIDASNTGWIEARLRALVTNHTAALLVDLSETTYLDSAGIALLFGLARELRLHQQRLHLVVGEASPIARMVSLTGLDRTVPTHPTPETALAELVA
jgi:anti-anti-sigma factor